MSAELIASFQAITGLNDQAKCKRFINDAHGNLELALSNYFDSGAPPPEDLHPSVFQPPPPIQEDVMQIEQEEPEEVPEPLEVAPALYPSQAIDKPLPLQGVSVKAQILNFMANIELAQRFVNDGKNPIEAVFQFQQYDSALHGFDVEVDGKIYKGKIKSKQKALEEYDDTIASGHGAYLLEKDKTRDDVYRINVGNLPPGKEATLRIYYLTELDTEGDSLRLVLPATRTKVYSKSGAKEQQQSEVNPALSGLNVHLDLEMNHDLVEITSPSHQIEVKLDGKKGTLDLKPNQEQRGRAMVILIKLANPHAPMVTIEKYKSAQSTDANTEKKRPAAEVEREEKRVKQDAVTVSLFPKVEIQDDPVCEIIFLVDRSGSMAGSRMNQTKNALQIFLRSLPVGTKFNIVGFGDTYEKLFPSSVFFDDRSLNTASNHVVNMQSNLIGTNILPPLRDILTREADPEYPRQVFCLTDGEVKNTEEVLDFVKNNAHGCRVFTFGIGADASKALVLGIAKYGHGKAEFIRSGERIEPVVMRQLKRALQPVLRDVNINWGPLPVAERKTAYDIPPIFDGDKLVVSTFLDPTAQTNNAVEQAPAKNEVVIQAKSGNESFEWRAEFDLQTTIDGELTHKLTAMKLIRDYEKNKAQNLKKEISDLGAVWGLVSSQTSYIAVEMRRNATEGNLEPMDVNEAVKVFGAENSEHIQVEDVRSRRLSHKSDVSRDAAPEPQYQQLQQAQPQFRKSASKLKSGGAGAIFDKIGSWFSGDKKEEEQEKVSNKRKKSQVASTSSAAPIGEDKYKHYRADDAMDAMLDDEEESSDEDVDMGVSQTLSADISNIDRSFTESAPVELASYGGEGGADNFSGFTYEPQKQMEMVDDQIIKEEPVVSGKLSDRSESKRRSRDRQAVPEDGAKGGKLKQSKSSEKLKKKDAVPEPAREKKAEKEKKEKKDKDSKKNLVAKPASISSPPPPPPSSHSANEAPPPSPMGPPGYQPLLSRSSSSSLDQVMAPITPQSNSASFGLGGFGAAPPRATAGGAPPPQPGGGPPSPKRSGVVAGGRGGYGSVSPTNSPRLTSSLLKTKASTVEVVDPVIKQITSAQRPLDRIVLAQAANGSFIAEHIAAALGVDVTRVKQALPAFLSALETSLLLWATAIALSFLETRESNSRDEWDLIGGKAKKYLTRTLNATPQLVELVLEEAKKFVATI